MKKLMTLGISGMLLLLLSGAKVPDKSEGMVLWLKADAIPKAKDGEKIALWPDASGKKNDVAQKKADLQPIFSKKGINGNPAIHFQGKGDNLATKSGFKTPYTIFAVAQQTGKANARIITSGSANWLMGWWRGKMHCMFAGGWVNKGKGTDKKPHLYAATGDGKETAVYHNGQKLAQNNKGKKSIGKLSLGAYKSGRESSEALVSEVIIYARVLPDNERKAVENYLMKKYKLK